MWVSAMEAEAERAVTTLTAWPHSAGSNSIFGDRADVGEYITRFRPDGLIISRVFMQMISPSQVVKSRDP